MIQDCRHNLSRRGCMTDHWTVFGSCMLAVVWRGCSRGRYRVCGEMGLVWGECEPSRTYLLPGILVPFHYHQTKPLRGYLSARLEPYLLAHRMSRARGRYTTQLYYYKSADSQMLLPRLRSPCPASHSQQQLQARRYLPIVCGRIRCCSGLWALGEVSRVIFSSVRESAARCHDKNVMKKARKLDRSPRERCAATPCRML